MCTPRALRTLKAGEDQCDDVLAPRVHLIGDAGTGDASRLRQLLDRVHLRAGAEVGLVVLVLAARRAGVVRHACGILNT